MRSAEKPVRRQRIVVAGLLAQRQYTVILRIGDFMAVLCQADICLPEICAGFIGFFAAASVFPRARLLCALWAMIFILFLNRAHEQEYSHENYHLYRSAVAWKASSPDLPHLLSIEQSIREDGQWQT